MLTINEFKEVFFMINKNYFTGKVCIVTGANSGIGYCLSEELIKRGAIVYLLGTDEEKINEAISKIGECGSRAHPLIVDVKVQDKIESAILNVISKEERIDFLFNNAGIKFIGPTEGFNVDDWKKIVEINLLSVIYGIYAVLPKMLEQGSGHIINTASIEGLLPLKYQTLYNTTKYAIVGLSESLRYEYLDRGIKTSVICQGFVDTDISNNKLDSDLDHGKKLAVENVIKSDDLITSKEVAIESLNKIAEGKGIIIVPEEPWKKIWQDYVMESKEVEETILKFTENI